MIKGGRLIRMKSGSKETQRRAPLDNLVAFGKRPELSKDQRQTHLASSENNKLNSSISLAEELRAIRNGGYTGMLFKHTTPDPDSDSAKRPWQEDIDRLQQTLQEVLAAVAKLSGVELPGAASGSEDTGDFQPQIDTKTLKDRIRDDLEAYSVRTASEIVKQAEEESRVALAAIRTEVDGQVAQVVGEFREKLQGQFKPEEFGLDISAQSRERVTELVQAQTDEFARWVWTVCKGTGTPIPAQIEKLLEPYVAEAISKLSVTFGEQVQNQIAEQEQLAQSRLQGALSSFEGQVSSFEQTAQQISERSADAASKLCMQRLSGVADDEAKTFESKIREQAQGSLAAFQMRAEEAANLLRQRVQQDDELKAENLKQRLASLASEVEEKKVSEITERIERTAADVIESSVQHLHQQADDSLEHSKEEIKGFLDQHLDEASQQIRDLGQSAHESLTADAGRVAESLKGLDQDLAGLRDKHVAASQEQLSVVVRGTMDSLSARVKEIADFQLEEMNKLVVAFQDKAVAQYESRLREITEGQCNDLLGRIHKEAGEAGAKVADEVRAKSESVTQEFSHRVNSSAAVLREEAMQATSRIELSLKNSLEAYRQQLAQITDAGIEEHSKAIRNSLHTLQSRLERSARILQEEESSNQNEDTPQE